jgi:hypothetical protein
MLRNVLCVILALVVCFAVSGLAKADDGVVVTSPAMGKMTVKIGDKDTEIEMKGLKVIGADGAQLKGKAIAEALKKDAKVEITKEGDKIVSIKIK